MLLSDAEIMTYGQLLAQILDGLVYIVLFTKNT